MNFVQVMIDYLKQHADEDVKLMECSQVCEYEKAGYRCKRVRYRESPYCIFHTVVEEKNADEFKLALRKELEEVKTSFERCLDLRGTLFLGDCGGTLAIISDLPLEEVNLRWSVFYGRLDMSKIEFPSKMEFGHCEFKSDANFALSKFGNNADVLKGYASFVNCKFRGNCNFLEAQFRVDARFQDSKFEASNFVGADFSRQAMFNNCVFSKHTDFSSAVFREGAGFYRSTHLSTTSFRSAEIYGTTNLKRLTLGNEDLLRSATKLSLVFAGAVLHGVLQGTELRAYGSVIINFAQLNGGVNLSGSVFHSKLSFLGAYIDRSFALRDCTLTELDMTAASGERQLAINRITATADTLTIRGLITSYDTWITPKELLGRTKRPYSLRLESCTFSGPVRIRDTIAQIEIRDCLFAAYLYVVGRNFEEGKSLSYTLNVYRTAYTGPACFIKPIIRDFTYCSITGKLHLYRANLEGAQFRGTNLSAIIFNEVSWPYMKRRGIPGPSNHQKCLADEPNLLTEDGNIHIGEDSGYVQPNIALYQPDGRDHEVIGEIRSLYNQVHRNYESQNRYGLAGPFKVAEYNLRENSKSVGCFEKTILHLYRLQSTYGTNTLKPVLWMLGVLLVPAFTIAVMLCLLGIILVSKEYLVNYLEVAVYISFKELFKLQLAYPFNLGILIGSSGVVTLLWAVQKIVFYLLWIQLVFAVREKIKR